jgi:hypothetical protein
LGVTGGTGNNVLTINDQGSGNAETYTVAATTFDRSGAARTTFSGMKKLNLAVSGGADTITVVNTSTSTPVVVTGGGGTDTLVGPNVTNTWSLTGANGGTVSNVTFSGISNLVGGSGNDTFKFNVAGSVSGTIDGGGGTNSLNYATYGGTVTVNLQTGAATTTGGMLNIGSVTGSTSSANQLIGANTPNSWSISGVNAGKLNSFSFTAMANLTGGTDINSFNVANGGSLSGKLNGGSGATNLLSYSKYTTSGVVVDLLLGSATAIDGGANGGISGIESVTGSSNGGDILVGDANPNTLTTSKGHNILIGGSGGGDTLTSGTNGADILIAGTTNYDTNIAALQAILAEWKTSTASNYASVISTIMSNSFADPLNSSTVSDAGSSDLPDTLTGSNKAATDWFFAHIAGGSDPNDIVAGKGSGDTLTGI